VSQVPDLIAATFARSAGIDKWIDAWRGTLEWRSPSHSVRVAKARESAALFRSACGA
jgi:hypothetical protein